MTNYIVSSKNLKNLYKDDKHVDVIIGHIEGIILGNRYQVIKYLDRGENGKVYEVKDLKKGKDSKPLVVKIQESTSMTKREIRKLEKV